MIIYFRKSKLIPIILTLVVVVGMASVGFQYSHANKSQTVPVSLKSQSVGNTALVWLFSNAIQEQSNLFYEPYYTINPTIAYYSTAVKRIEEKGAQINITFSTLPYIGPHDTIGEDEITFSISHSGKIALVDFKHLKSYSLPDNLKSIEKGMLPPITK